MDIGNNDDTTITQKRDNIDKFLTRAEIEPETSEMAIPRKAVCKPLVNINIYSIKYLHDQVE